MNTLSNIYPRGIILDPEKSNTIVNLDMPATAQAKAVFWLARNGYVYKTRADALVEREGRVGYGFIRTSSRPAYENAVKNITANTALSPDDKIAQLNEAAKNFTAVEWKYIPERDTALQQAITTLQKGERLFYHSGKMSATIREPENDWSPLVRARFFRMSFKEVPYAISLKSKPGNHSTLWVSKTGKPYANYSDALEDDKLKSISLTSPGVNKKRQAVIGIIVIIAIISLLIYFNKKK